VPNCIQQLRRNRCRDKALRQREQNSHFSVDPGQNFVNTRHLAQWREAIHYQVDRDDAIRETLLTLRRALTSTMVQSLFRGLTCTSP
jgi:hypothetical protein